MRPGTVAQQRTNGGDAMEQTTSEVLNALGREAYLVSAEQHGIAVGKAGQSEVHAGGVAIVPRRLDHLYVGEGAPDLIRATVPGRIVDDHQLDGHGLRPNVLDRSLRRRPVPVVQDDDADGAHGIAVGSGRATTPY
jgi:hypothetical protein